MHPCVCGLTGIRDGIPLSSSDARAILKENKDRIIKTAEDILQQFHNHPSPGSGDQPHSFMTSSTQLNAADTVGNPTVLVINIIA